MSNLAARNLIERANDSYLDAGARGTGSEAGDEESGSRRSKEIRDTELNNLRRGAIAHEGGQESLRL